MKFEVIENHWWGTDPAYRCPYCWLYLLPNEFEEHRQCWRCGYYEHEIPEKNPEPIRIFV